MRKFVVAVLVLAGQGVPAQAKASQVKMADVPATVMQAADTALPGVEWKTATKTEEDGLEGKVHSYVVSGVEKQGKKRKVSFVCLEDGIGGVVRISVEPTDLPAAVVNALKADQPDFRMEEEAVAIGASADNVIYYRVVGKMGGKGAAFMVS